MSTEKPQDRLGLPPQGPGPRTDAAPGEGAESADRAADTSEERAADVDRPIRREDEPSERPVGVPESPPRAATPLTEKDRRELRERMTRARLRQEEEAERRLEEELAKSEHFLRLPDFIFHPTVVLLLIVAAGLFALFAMAQAASLLATLGELPPALRYVAWGSLLVILGAVLYAALRLAFSYLRLRRNRQVPLPGLQELARRAELHRAVQKKQWEATRRLKDYLRDYPLDNRRTRSLLRDCGLDEDALGDLQGWKERLLSADGFADSESWLHDFRHSFQSHLDRAARSRRSRCARMTAVKTAISPNPLVDSLITLYYSYTLIGDLCRIYRVRAGAVGTVLIAGHVFINSYLAGKADEGEEITEPFIESLFGAGGKLAAEIGGKVVSKGAAGAFNYLLMHRLGRTAANLFRPVRT